MENTTSNRVPDEVREAFLRFSGASTAFASALERLDATPVRAFLQQIRAVLVELYAAAIDLPDVEPETDTDLASDSPQPGSVYGKLSDKLGDAALYWEVYNPTVEESPVRASLADDLSDIHLALQKLIPLEQAGAHVTELVFDARLDFQIHWWDMQSVLFGHSTGFWKPNSESGLTLLAK